MIIHENRFNSQCVARLEESEVDDPRLTTFVLTISVLNERGQLALRELRRYVDAFALGARLHETNTVGLDVSEIIARRVCPHAPAERNDACRLGICNQKTSGPAKMIGTSPKPIHPNRREQILEDVKYAIDQADLLACDTEHTSAIRTLCGAVANLVTLVKGSER